MQNFSLNNLIDLINEIGEQDDSAEISITLDNVNSSFDDLGVDSLTFFSVVAQLESQYGIRIGLRDASAATTPAELFDLVEKRLEPA